MHATRHAVLVGQGKLPQELRDVLLRRVGQPQPDLAIRAPRLLATFPTAIDAERVAGQVQRLRIGTVVAGPEQPPAQDSWSVATSLERTPEGWLVTIANETRAVLPIEATSLAIVDWRPESAPVDRALLIRLSTFDRPLFIRASTIDHHRDVGPTPVAGLRAMHELVDDLALAMPTDARSRSRRLSPIDFTELEGDLLPLAVAMVEALDEQPAQLSRPLSGGPRAASDDPHDLLLTGSFGKAVTTALLGEGIVLGALAMGLALAGVVGLLAGQFDYLIDATALFAVSMFKIAWGRWLSRGTFPKRSRLLSRVLGDVSSGWRPHPAGLLVNLPALYLLHRTTLIPHTQLLLDLSFWLLAADALPSLLAVYLGRRPPAA